MKVYGDYQRYDTPLYGNDQRCDIYGDEDYMDEAFSTDDLGRRQKYREAIRQME